MSRFGATGTFYYAPGDVLTSPSILVLDASQMPQYPFDNYAVTDRTSYRSKSGKMWSYENYNIEGYVFRWSMLDETTKIGLRVMYDSKPIFSFNSNGLNFGTFRMSESAWKDSEVAFELYDVSFSAEESG